jgi:hypothetical protein
MIDRVIEGLIGSDVWTTVRVAIRFAPIARIYPR